MNSSDSIINLVVHGKTPSKKNSRRIIHVHGRIMVMPSIPYREWHKTALLELKNAHTLNGTCEVVHLTFYAENKRKFDLSNKAESIMDLLVDAGIIEDDNYSIVPKLILEYGGQDKENPRCEIQMLRVQETNR